MKLLFKFRATHVLCFLIISSAYGTESKQSNASMRKQSDASDVQSAIDLSGATMTKLVNYLKSLKFRQEYHEKKLDKTIRRLTAVESNIRSALLRVTTVENSIRNTDMRMKTVKNSISNTNIQMTSVLSSIKNTNVRLTSVESSVRSTSVVVNAVQTNIRSTNVRVSKAETSIRNTDLRVTKAENHIKVSIPSNTQNAIQCQTASKTIRGSTRPRLHVIYFPRPFSKTPKVTLAIQSNWKVDNGMTGNAKVNTGSTGNSGNTGNRGSKTYTSNGQSSTSQQHMFQLGRWAQGGFVGAGNGNQNTGSKIFTSNANWNPGSKTVDSNAHQNKAYKIINGNAGSNGYKSNGNWKTGSINNNVSGFKNKGSNGYKSNGYNGYSGGKAKAKRQSQQEADQGYKVYVEMTQATQFGLKVQAHAQRELTVNWIACINLF